MNIPQCVYDKINYQKQICKEYRDSFMNYLLEHTEEDVLQRYFFYGKPFVFRDNEDEFIELKNDIAKNFNVDSADIYMVGSAKFGFSLNPTKKYRDWTEDSDIDIAIIDSKLFDKYWHSLYCGSMDLTDRTEEEDQKYHIFLEYFFRGWLRPDYLPKIEKKSWFDFFQSLHSKYKYHVAAGIYREKEFFKYYHSKNLIRIREEKKNER